MRSKYGPGGEFDPEWYEKSYIYLLALMVAVLGNPMSHHTLEEMAAPRRLVEVFLLEVLLPLNRQSLPQNLRGATSMRLLLQNYRRGRGVSSKGMLRLLLQVLQALPPRPGPLHPGLLGSVSGA